MNTDPRRKLPAVNAVIETPGGARLAARFGRQAVLDTVRNVIESLRSGLGGEAESPEPAITPESVLIRAETFLEAGARPSLRRAINATGIIMHSGLGRAVLPPEAVAALAEIAPGYCTLALDPVTGRRSSRDLHIAGILRDLTGAEAATVVNNNAAATVLVLNTLARGKEVVVSRGQLVEIGGSFRMPEVMAMSGAILREVGATNKTHIRDYRNAIGAATGAILRVHHSNYRIVGFAGEPGLEDLVGLGREMGIPVIDDIGSGALVDLKAYGLETEPTARASVRAGADVVCFSGDKLIGGPQSGIILGRANLVAAIKSNPLARAFRCGKLTLAALEATLKLFLNPESLGGRHPVYQMLSLDVSGIGRRAQAVRERLRAALPPDVEAEVIDGASQVGSGAVPVETLPSKLLALKSASISPDEIGRRLRNGNPAVYTRIREDAILLDFRTVRPEEEGVLETALLRALKGL